MGHAHDASMLSERPDEVRRGRGSGDWRYVALPQWVLLMPVSDAALRVYALLLAHVNTADERHEVWPQQQSLAAMLGRHRNTISRAIRELAQAGLVTVTVERYGPNRSRRRNVYVVHTSPPDDHEGPASVAEWHAEQRPEPAPTNRRDRKRAGQPGRTKNGVSGRTTFGASGRTTDGAGTRRKKNELKKNPPTPRHRHRALPSANADRPRPLLRPAWCGDCDERTRHRTVISDDGRERTRRCPRCHPLAVAEVAEVAESVNVAESVTNAESVANDVAETTETTEVANVAEVAEVASNDVAERAVSVAEVAEVAESVNVAEVIADLRSVLAAIQRQRCHTQRAERHAGARTAGRQG